MVTRNAVSKDSGETDIINVLAGRWPPPLGNRGGGHLASNSDIAGDSSTCRCEETPMADLVADAILYGTEAPDERWGRAGPDEHRWCAQRACKLDNQISGGEQPGEITYAEAYNVAPFNNILVTVST